MKFFTSLFLSIVAIFFFSNTALAGGGPPETFDDLKFVAQYIENTMNLFEESGEIPDNYYSNKCTFWNSMIANFMYYYKYDAQFRAAATAKKVRNNTLIKIAKETGYNADKIKKYRKRRNAAKAQLHLLDYWWQLFHEYHANTAWNQQAFHCAPEEICSVETEEPIQTGSVFAQTYDSMPHQFNVGFGQLLFSFTLTLNDVEDGLFNDLEMTVLTSDTGIEYHNLYNCTLRAQSEPFSTLAYAGSPVENTASYSGRLHFNFQNAFFLEKGGSETFEVTCDIKPAFNENDQIMIGFISWYDNAPSQAISVIGNSSGMNLLLEPDNDLLNYLTF